MLISQREVCSIMWIRIKKYVTVTVCSVIMSLLLIGCGGGGGGPAAGTQIITPGPSVSGIAAAGAVISGTVYLKDSAASPELSKTIAADGSYSFDVTDKTPPYLLKVVGKANNKDYTLFSMATDKGTANINPITNLVVANAASAAGKSDPATIYDSPTLPATQAIAAKLPQAVTDITNFLNALPLVNNGISTNPISDIYPAIGTKLDALLDKMNISVSGGTVTITDTGNVPIQNTQVSSIKAATYNISGTITSGGAPLAGVIVSTTTGVSSTTGTDGRYAILALADKGTYTITAAKNSYVLSSVTSNDVVINGANVTKDFTATASATTYSISGTITSGGFPLSGVNVSISGGSATTDANGNYTIASLHNGSYTITPSKNNIVYAPVSLVVTINGADSTGNDFTATSPSVPTFNITGTITKDAVGFGGVSVTLSNTTFSIYEVPGFAGHFGTGEPVVGTAVKNTQTADSSGIYTFTGVPSGTYTITPYKALDGYLNGYAFNPKNSNVITIADDGHVYVYDPTLTGNSVIGTTIIYNSSFTITNNTLTGRDFTASIPGGAGGVTH
jgi:hypothetical protein